MSINETDPRLTAYVFGELSDPEKVALEAELARDEAARAQVAELQRTIAALRFEFSETKPPELEPERREKIAQTVGSAQIKKQRRWLVGAAGLVSAAALILLYVGLQPNPRDHVADVAPPSALPSVGTTAVAPLELAPPDVAPSNPGLIAERPVERLPEAAPESPAPAAPRGVKGRSAPLRGFASPIRSPEVVRELGFTGGGAARSPMADEPRPSAHASQGLAGPVAAAPVAATPSVGAGEWDDNANYREFMRWTASERTGAHPIEVRDRRFIVVRDSAGLGVPNCRVVITDESDRQTELITSAAGRVILFPHAEGLTGRTLTAATECAGAARKAFSLSGPDGVVELRTAARRSLPTPQTIDVAFILDSTGSMAEEIAAVKSTIQKVTRGLRNSNVRIRLGLVEYKDRSDSFVTRVFAMSTDLDGFSRQIDAVQASGGGDTPESVNEALHVGIHDLSWNDGALARLAFLVGDAPPHLDYPQDYDYALEARDAAHRGIQIYTIAASGMDTLGQVVWRQVAQYTGATNLFVLRGGAGPQSVGAGDPKSSCGGTQTSYTSGNLDALVLAKINGVLRSLERDPMRIPGLNGDENAKPCAERMHIGQ